MIYIHECKEVLRWVGVLGDNMHTHMPPIIQEGFPTYHLHLFRIHTASEYSSTSLLQILIIWVIIIIIMREIIQVLAFNWQHSSCNYHSLFHAKQGVINPIKCVRNTAIIK